MTLHELREVASTYHQTREVLNESILIFVEEIIIKSIKMSQESEN